MRRTCQLFLLIGCQMVLFPHTARAQAEAQPGVAATSAPTLEEARLKMEKWIETEQIISKERKDWQQGKEILAGRLEPIRNELSELKERTGQAEASVAEAKKKRGELVAEHDRLKSAAAQLTESVTGLETMIRRLYTQIPEPIQARIQPLYERIPGEVTKTHVSVAERYQNILGILNELNKANSEITVSYEVHNLADGKPSEVKALYVGLGQAYYVSARGEAGIGRPTNEGWKWEPSTAIAQNVLAALEILQGKQSPTFLPLPVEIQ